MTNYERIVINPTLCHGTPVIRGTRIPVTIVVRSLAGGMTFEEVRRKYDITGEDIREALKYAGELADHDSYHPLAS